MKVAGNNLPNTEQGLINRVLEMNYSIIASYLDIPSASNVTIRIQKCGESAEILLFAGSLSLAVGQTTGSPAKPRDGSGQSLA